MEFLQHVLGNCFGKIYNLNRDYNPLIPKKAEPIEYIKKQNGLCLVNLIVLFCGLTIATAYAAKRWGHLLKRTLEYKNQSSSHSTSSSADDLLNQLRHLQSLLSRCVPSFYSTFQFSDLMDLFTKGPIPETLDLLFACHQPLEPKNKVWDALEDENVLNELESSLTCVLEALRKHSKRLPGNGGLIAPVDQAFQESYGGRPLTHRQSCKPKLNSAYIDSEPYKDFDSSNKLQMASVAVRPKEAVSLVPLKEANDKDAEFNKTEANVSHYKSNSKGSTLNIQIDFDRKIRLGCGL